MESGYWQPNKNVTQTGSAISTEELTS
uniref:Uncharacterized protein n=1 Tax=Anguilla anguilla TaxID=7936 RepID=A0A0E9S385_ANGAN